MSPPKLVWTAEEIAAAEFRFGHPLEDAAEANMVTLGRLAGMERAGLNLVRVEPGRKAFPLHRHMNEEEWTWVLEGQATVTLGDQVEELGPGGFVFFPPGGPAHQVENRGETDLLCLMGGENRPTDTVDFPQQNKRMTKTRRGVEIGPADQFEPFDFFARTPLPMGTE